jgi:hypothetical protein
MNRIFLIAVMLMTAASAYAAPFIPPECPKMKAELKANGGKAISCTRTRKHQISIVTQMCGKPVTCARASMNSKHVEKNPSCACDFATRHAPKAGGKWLPNNKGHRGNHMSDTGR